MSWNLHVILSGLLVVLPSKCDDSILEAVFVNTGEGENQHFCQMSVFGVVGRSDPGFPFDLNTHDIYLYDGNELIAPAPPLVLRPLDGLPKLQKAKGFNKYPQQFVQRPDFPGNLKLWSARIGLYGGSVSEANLTEETWVIYDRLQKKDVYGPERLAQSLLYEVAIESDEVTVEARSKTRSLWWTVKPKSPLGAAEIHIANLSSQSMRYKKDQRNDSPHFRLAFDLFQGSTDCILIESTKHPTIPPGATSGITKGVHVPCVGGCSIC